MSAPAATAQRTQQQQQGAIASLITLPFRFFGVLCGSLLLCIAIECVGMHFVWPNQSWHHAQAMLDHELDQFSTTFKRSAMVEEPGHTARWLVDRGYDILFVKSGLLDSLHEPATRTHTHEPDQPPLLRDYLTRIYVGAKAYIIASAYTVLTFLVRCLVLTLSLPLFATGAFVGLVDGLARRDVRRFGAGRESGFLYHHAKASLMPLAVLPWVTYLALPISVPPLLILLPSVALLGIATNIAATTFKKYL